MGFCWAAVYPAPDSLALALDGCYWAHPYDLVLFDFRFPESLPYPELARFAALDEFSGWVDNETIALKREVEIRKSDGALYDALSEQEQAVLDSAFIAGDDSLSGYRKEIVYCKRPHF